MKKLLSLFFLIHFTASVFATSPVSPPKNSLSEYQMQVIEYFKEIALGYEYGTASAVTRKWVTSVKIYLDGSPAQIVRHELDLVVEELNELITDEIQITLVSERSEANVHLYIGTENDYTSLYPYDVNLLKNNSGVFTVSWNKKNEIVKGRIFIRNDLSVQEQRHAVREELTQSLGLGKDSVLYPESVFQLVYTLPIQFAPIDKELIRLLYHPKMTSGLTALDVESVLTGILLSEQKL